MKVNKDIQRMARRLFMLCMKEGNIDEVKLKACIDLLVTRKPRNYQQILFSIKELLRLAIAKKTVEVTSASSLTESEKQQILTTIRARHGKEVLTHWIVDPSVIAGLHIKIGDTVVDGTLKTRISHFLPPL